MHKAAPVTFRAVPLFKESVSYDTINATRIASYPRRRRHGDRVYDDTHPRSA